MFENISSTLNQCGCFFIAGLIMGLLYEPLRFLRMMIRHNAAAVFAEDTLYMSLWGFISFIIALSVGIGYFRIFYAVFELLGAALYFLTLGRAVNFIMRRSVGRIKKFFYAIYKKIQPRLVAFFSFIAKKIKSIFGKIAEIMPTITLNGKNDLKNEDEMLYNIKVQSDKGGEGNSVIKAKIRKKA
ncbi:MAG: spore cortex biosynthesis protein YabQ [[Eubacterium] siraeum]|nr:spore cortex biosynthesis protein YabQ [[Eubacterium] siraeum]